MNKRDLIEAVSCEAQLTKTDAARAVEALVHAVQQGLGNGDRVALQGLGTFSLTERKAKWVRDPNRGTPMEIPARRVARFTPGLELKSIVERARGRSPNGAG